MEYVLELALPGPAARAAAAYADASRWAEWQLGFVGAGEVRDGRRTLTFEFPSGRVVMTEEVIAAGPDRYDAVYENWPFWNRCENRFADADEGCLWTMRCWWRFGDHVPDASTEDAERFEATTRSSMADFEAWLQNNPA